MPSNHDAAAQVARPTQIGHSEDSHLHSETQGIMGRIPIFRQGPRLSGGFKPEYVFGEHSFLGDHIKLKRRNHEEYTAGDEKFLLPNGLHLTYGQINGLAGDFYGTNKPISDGGNNDEMCRRFRAAWGTLAGGQPEMANDILHLLQAEVDILKNALREGKAPSEAYRDLPNNTLHLEAITLSHAKGPGFLGLALINWDHFGHDAHKAYVAGHTVALETAAAGDLELGYAMNAFADHFLQDSFSAGHARTPRRYLHGGKMLYDLCAMCMHDEDNAIGLITKNKAGDEWRMFGDNMLLNPENERNMQLCQKAVQASAYEIFAAWETGSVPKPQDYICRNLVPSLAGDSARGPQDLAALFQFDGQRRENVLDRRTAEYTKNWTAFGTLKTCLLSGWWKHPITLDGPHKKNIQDEQHLEGVVQMEEIPAEGQDHHQVREEVCIWCT